MADVVAGAHGITHDVREQQRSSGALASTAWLLGTSTGSLADGADTAALLLAAGANLANGGADASVGGAIVLHRPDGRAVVAVSYGVVLFGFLNDSGAVFGEGCCNRGNDKSRGTGAGRPLYLLTSGSAAEVAAALEVDRRG